MSVAEVAAALGLTKARIRQLAQDGRLPGEKVGRDWVFTVDAVAAFRSQPRRRAGRPRKDDTIGVPSQGREPGAS